MPQDLNSTTDRSSRISRWLRRMRKSERTRKKFIMQMVFIAITLMCLLIGYYYLGPSLAETE